MQTQYIQGRAISGEQLDWIRRLISEHPKRGRYRLSIEIAQQWNWRNAAGQLKDMAARTMLLKLERRGLIQLPRRQRGGGSLPTQPPNPEQLQLFTQSVIDAPLGQLLPLRLEPVHCPTQRRLLADLLGQHHYLGYRRPVGENLQYLAQDKDNHPLGCLVFGAPAWKCAPRDQYIGWDGPTRERHLHLLANHMRFLILPWVRVKHLASHLLALAAGRISADWQRKYGHPIYLLESFVQRDRFQGSCYRAANWICAGQTQGRSRNDCQRSLRLPCKHLYLYPLRSDFRAALLRPPNPNFSSTDH